MRYRPFVPTIPVPHCPKCFQGDDEVVAGEYPEPTSHRWSWDGGSPFFETEAAVPMIVNYIMRDGCKISAAEWDLVMERNWETRRVSHHWTNITKNDEEVSDAQEPATR